MLVVLDIETTGLDPDIENILEVGAIVVTDDLAPVDEFKGVAWFDYRQRLSEFITDMHTKSGLLDECAESELFFDDVDVLLADWLIAHGATEGSVILCGHTIDFDHKFLMAHFPETAKLLHYRKNDFGAVARFLKLCGLEFEHTPSSEYPHRGLDDCRIELAEAQAMRELIIELTTRPDPQEV